MSTQVSKNISMHLADSGFRKCAFEKKELQVMMFQLICIF